MKIAKNSAYLFFRSIVLIFIGFYSSRVLLGKLGVEDYGIYSIVGGVVVMFGSLRSMFTNAIQRFLNYGRGQGDISRVNRVFVTGLQVQFILTIAFIILAETIGLYAFRHLNIPDARFPIASIVYQLIIVSFAVSMATLPFDALIISNERMNVFAWLSILERLVRLCIIFLIDIGPLDHLISYAILSLGVTLLIRTIAIVYCRRHFIESKLNWVVDKPLMREMGGFAGWNFLGFSGYQITHEGVNYILNLYGGVVVNAARSFAYSITGYINQLVGNVNTAFKPQTNAAAAKEEKHLFHVLLGYNAKVSFIAYLIIMVPVFIFAKQLLQLWLGQVPEYAASFIYGLSGYFLLRSLHELVNQFFVSIGEMKEYQIIEVCAMILIIPVAVLMLHCNCPYWSVFMAMTLLEAINHGLTVWLAVKKYGFPLSYFVKKVYIPFFVMTLLTVCLVSGAFRLGINQTESWLWIVIRSALIECLLLTYTYLLVLNSEDKVRVKELIVSWRHR